MIPQESKLPFVFIAALVLLNHFKGLIFLLVSSQSKFSSDGVISK